jgi:isopenicillin-N epimerase
LSWTGTKDPAAALSVPAAIQFMQEHDWETVRQRCNQMLDKLLPRLSQLTGLPPAYPAQCGFYRQMAAVPLPAEVDLAVLKTRLYEEYKIEIPVIAWNEQKFVRVSVQGYNTSEDLDRLVSALGHLL